MRVLENVAVVIEVDEAAIPEVAVNRKYEADERKADIKGAFRRTHRGG